MKNFLLWRGLTFSANDGGQISIQLALIKSYSQLRFLSKQTKFSTPKKMIL